MIINAYFSGRFLRDALASVLAQSYEDWEVILWENVSSDAEDIAHEFHDSRIRYLYSPKKVSLYQSRVNAIGVASGEIVAFLDCDDVWLPDKLEVQLETFKDDQCVVSCTDYFVHHGDAIPSDPTALSERYETYRSSPDGAFAILADYRVAMSTVAVRKSALQNAWPDSVPSFSIIEDLDMVLRAVSAGSLVPVPEPLCVYRRHDDNFSKRVDIELKEWREWLDNVDDVEWGSADKVLIRELVGQRILSMQCRQSRLSGDVVGTWKAVRQLPWNLIKVKYLMSLAVPTAMVRRLVRT